MTGVNFINTVLNYATPITREGVSQPYQLSRIGQAAHYTRRGGPGTRSKNPVKYDRDGKPGRRSQ